jgi:hypothetical protein
MKGQGNCWKDDNDGSNNSCHTEQLLHAGHYTESQTTQSHDHSRWEPLLLFTFRKRRPMEVRKLDQVKQASERQG